MQTTLDQNGEGRVNTADTLRTLGLSSTSQKTLRRYARKLGIDSSRGFYYTSEIAEIRKAMDGAKEEDGLDKWLKKQGANQVKEKTKQATESAKKIEREEFEIEQEEAVEAGAIAVSTLSDAYLENADKLAEISAIKFMNRYEQKFFTSLKKLADTKLAGMRSRMNGLLEVADSPKCLEGDEEIELLLEEGKDE